MICNICTIEIKEEEGRLDNYQHYEGLILCNNCYGNVQKEIENPRVCDWRDEQFKEEGTGTNKTLG